MLQEVLRVLDTLLMVTDPKSVLLLWMMTTPSGRQQAVLLEAEFSVLDSRLLVSPPPQQWFYTSRVHTDSQLTNHVRRLGRESERREGQRDRGKRNWGEIYSRWDHTYPKQKVFTIWGVTVPLRKNTGSKNKIQASIPSQVCKYQCIQGGIYWKVLSFDFIGGPTFPRHTAMGVDSPAGKGCAS